MRHIVFEIPTPWGSIPIMGYGLMIVLGFLFGIGLACWRAKRCGEHPNHVMNLGLLALLGGIAGARLFYVLGDLDSFTGRGVGRDLLAMLNVRAGGLVFYGGLLVATGLCVLYMRRKRLSARRLLDIVAPSLMLGLAFGRAGCMLNGCCWGGKCTFESPEVAKLLSTCFPFASPPFDQQSQMLPWQVYNPDNQLVGYFQARQAPLPGGRRTLLHVPANVEAKLDPPYLRVPLALLRPVIPAEIDGQPAEKLPWQVIDARGDTVCYYTLEKSKEDVLQRVWADPDKPPAKPWITVEQRYLVTGADSEPAIGYEYLSREELKTAEQRKLAAAFRAKPIYPVQLFGIANALLLCWVLTLYFPRRKREGQVFALMLTLYPISRFLLEEIRKDTDAVALGLTLSQNLSLYIFAASLALWWAISRLPAVAPVPLSGTLETPPRS